MMRVAYFLIHQSADYWVAPQNVVFTLKFDLAKTMAGWIQK